MHDEATDRLKPEETTDELTPDELAAQTGAELPDREAMSIAPILLDAGDPGPPRLSE